MSKKYRSKQELRLGGYFKKHISEILKLQEESREINRGGKIEKSPKLEEIATALDQFYFLQKLKLYTQYLSRGRTLPLGEIISVEELKLINPILQELEKNDFGNPAIKIFLAIKDLLIKSKQQKDKTSHQLQKEDGLFRNLESLIEKHQASFENNELIEIYSYLSIFAVKQYNLHQLHYLPKSITLYNKILNLQFEDIKDKDTVLSSNIFKNMVVLSLLYPKASFWNKITTPHLTPKDENLGFASAKEWVEAFIDFYHGNVHTKDYDKFIIFCRAKLLFHKKEFLPALKLLRKLSKTYGLYINFDIKILYLQTLYEVESRDLIPEVLSEEIEKLRDSYRNQLESNKRVHYQRVHYQAFYEHFNKLYLYFKKYKEDFDRGTKQHARDSKKLKASLDTYLSLSYKNWITSKFEAINQK